MRIRILMATIIAMSVCGTIASAQMMLPTLNDTITVISTGEATANPDVCKIEFSIEATGDSMTDLTKELDEKLESAEKTLKAAGANVTIGEKKYASAGGGLMQMFGKMDENAPAGYTVSASVLAVLNIKDMSAADAMKTLDATIATSQKTGLTLSRFGFGLQDNSVLLQQAAKNALDKSSIEAASIAAASGKQLDGVASIASFDMSKMLGNMFGGMGGAMKTVMNAMFTGGELSDSPNSISVDTTLIVVYKTK